MTISAEVGLVARGTPPSVIPGPVIPAGTRRHARQYLHRPGRRQGAIGRLFRFAPKRVRPSSPAFNEALFDAGLIGRRGLPGQALLMRAYEVAGETLPSMALARLAAKAFRDKPVDAARDAAGRAVDALYRQIGPWLHPVLAGHRSAGRTLVLATTSPYDLVRPLADRLGFDHVVATRYASRVDTAGVLRYTGKLDGGFVWATGKLGAVRRWAATQRVDLSDSWAYSDSIFDLPLLCAVGHPTAVNPDLSLLAAATLRRWPVAHFDTPPGVPKLLGTEIQDVARVLLTPAAFPYARFDISGSHHIPRRGPIIVAANHRSYFDPVGICLAVYDGGRNPRTLAKKELFDAPVVGQVMRAVGAICVDRDGNPGAAMAGAEAALDAGECVVIMPQGTIPRGEAFFEPRLEGRSGVARLAAATGASVVPLGIWGSEHVWPRSSRLPNVTNLVHPPTVRVRVGPPVLGLTGTEMGADTSRIMAAIVAQLPPEATLSRIPGARALLRTMPPS
jgi:putative phosphoserine phosphatase/1-acylglycerol-3-phosphate O-acyltransferase